MIEHVAKSLRSACLCILEVGGAFGHRFQALIEFLGLTTLIITDIDSVAIVTPVVGTSPEGEEDEEIEEFDVPVINGDPAAEPAPDVVPAARQATPAASTEKKYARACLPSVAGAATSNQTLIKWLPGKLTIAELSAASEADRIHELTDGAMVRVAYQTVRSVTWKGTTGSLCGRTLEEDFGLENPDWAQAEARKPLGLIVKGNPADPCALAAGLHRNVSRKSFDKTKFALAVLTEESSSWRVPAYIRDGLVWLQGEVKLEEPSILVPIAVDEEANANEVAE
jgi:hypothetical protein